MIPPAASMDDLPPSASGEEFSVGPPAPDTSTPQRRIPNLAHALLFVAFAGLILVLSQLLLLALGKSAVPAPGATITVTHPKWQLGAEGATYLLTLVTAWFFYPVVWRRTFLEGLQWNWSAARSQAIRLIPLGFALGVVVQFVTQFTTPPKTIPIDQFFLTASDAWLITFFGICVAPLFEEICFRGFLVPAFAAAYDWLSMPRIPSALARWHTSTDLTPAALLFSSILSSVFFALLHAQQVAHALPALLVLFAVSLVLTFVRVRTRSVAASTLVHASYNALIFLLALFQTGGYRHLERMSQ